MVKQAEFDSADFECKFTCEHDPRFENSYTTIFKNTDFFALENGSEDISLEKFAAN
jgi:site-specific DNA-cytosine methylase